MQCSNEIKAAVLNKTQAVLYKVSGLTVLGCCWHSKLSMTSATSGFGVIGTDSPQNTRHIPQNK